MASVRLDLRYSGILGAKLPATHLNSNVRVFRRIMRAKLCVGDPMGQLACHSWTSGGGIYPPHPVSSNWSISMENIPSDIRTAADKVG